MARAIYREKEYPVKGFCKSARGEDLVDLVLPNGMFERVFKDEVILLEDKPDNIDWEQRRYEIAKEAALRMIDIKAVTQKYGLIAVNARDLADAVIAELRKEA